MTCELEQIQMKDLVEILRSDMDSLVQRLSASDIVELEDEDGKTITRTRSVKFELRWNINNGFDEFLVLSDIYCYFLMLNNSKSRNLCRIIPIK